MGWIYSPLSPRRIELKSARAQLRGIRAAYPRIRHVGVFARNSLGEILEIVRRTPELDLLQVVEGPGFIAELAARLGRAPDSSSAARTRRIGEGNGRTNGKFNGKFNGKTDGCSPEAPRGPGIVPVLRVDSPLTSAELLHTAPWPLLLLDSRVAGRAGGTGVRFDPRFAAGAGRPFLIAGGLRPGNVCEALALSGAIGADVSSGIEIKGAPGRKDPELLREFIANARSLQLMNGAGASSLALVGGNA